MSTSWPYPGSTTIVCSMGKHERCPGNCSCDCLAGPLDTRSDAAYDTSRDSFSERAVERPEAI
jgi:hypothetical protein